MTRRVPTWLWLVIIAALLRLPTLGAERLWFDETFTAWTVAPGSDFWGAVMGDVHPPGWPLMQAVMVRIFGDSELAFRLLAALFGIGVVILVWRVALSLGFYRRTAFTAGLLAALLPASIYFSQDGRQYSALAFFVLLTLWAGKRRNYILLGLSWAAAAYMQNVGVLYGGAIGLAFLCQAVYRRKWDRAAMLALSAAIFLVLWLPWAYVGIVPQLARPAAGYWVAPLSVGGAIWPLVLSVGWRMQDAIQMPVYGIFIGLTMVALINCRRWLYSTAAWPLWAVLAGGPLLLVAYSLLAANVYVYRALYPSGVALCLLWAYTLNHLSQENLSYARPLVAVALAVAVLSHYVPAWGRPDPTRITEQIRAGWQTGDVIYYLNATDAIGIGWYARDLPSLVRPRVGSLLHVTQECKRAFRLREWSVEHDRARRAWVFVSSQPYTPRDEIEYVADLLAAYPHELVLDSGAKAGLGDQLYLVSLDE